MTLRPAKDREITNPESAAHLTESDAGEPQSTPALADHTPSWQAKLQGSFQGYCTGN